MFNPNALQVSIAVLAAVSVVTDLKWGKLYNAPTLGALGVAACGTFSNLSGFPSPLQALAGFGVGLLVLGIPYALGAMAAGDVKLLMAFGALGGVTFALETAFLGLLLGGAMGLLQLGVRGKARPFFRKLYRLFVSLMVPGLEVERPKIDRTVTFPFGVPLSVAAVWCSIRSPLPWLGVHL